MARDKAAVTMYCRYSILINAVSIDPATGSDFRML